MSPACALFFLLAAGGDAPPSEVRATTAVVYLADGSTLPLRDWAFSYEYQAWETGRPQGLPSRRETTDLWLGKRAIDVADSTLSVTYAAGTDGTAGNGRAKELVFEKNKKKSSLKLDPPHRDLLLPGGGKGLNVMATSVDFVGATLTGTRRQICLAPFTALVECSGAERVIRIEFSR